MLKIPNEALGRPDAATFAMMPKLPVTVVLDNIRSLNNVGAFFRTCDAFAMERIVLCGITATPPNREIHKTALGAENTVAWEYGKSTVEVLQRLKTEGYLLVAIEQVENSILLQNFMCKTEEKYALIFGNEVDGVSQEVVDMCDTAIELPQAGTKHSINVSVCGGVVLWHFFSALWPRMK